MDFICQTFDFSLLFEYVQTPWTRLKLTDPAAEFCLNSSGWAICISSRFLSGFRCTSASQTFQFRRWIPLSEMTIRRRLQRSLSTGMSGSWQQLSVFHSTCQRDDKAQRKTLLDDCHLCRNAGLTLLFLCLC